MRYALRNQVKLAEAFSTAYVKRMILSLDNYFKKNEDVVAPIFHEGDTYPFILVDDSTHSEAVFEFWIVKKVYDSYLLAYKSIIS